MNCHGHDTRVRIVENYNIKCTAHIRLLNEQIIRSDAERDITDTYYIFECVNKNDDNDVDRIVCGTGAARDLLQLANITAPPILICFMKSVVKVEQVGQAEEINIKTKNGMLLQSNYTMQ